jgi:hypothetical protein
VGNRDVEVHPISLRPRCIHLLKPDSWELAGGIDDRMVLNSGSP